MSTRKLTELEQRRWHVFKIMSEQVRARIVRDITEATGLSEPDFAILSRLEDLGGGTLRQAELAHSVGWHRSRLSHHLTRMEERGLVRRLAPADAAGVTIAITKPGRAAIAKARPVHAEAVRQHLLDRLTPEEWASFEIIGEKLSGNSA